MVSSVVRTLSGITLVWILVSVRLALVASSPGFHARSWGSINKWVGNDYSMSAVQMSISVSIAR